MYSPFLTEIQVQICPLQFLRLLREVEKSQSLKIGDVAKLASNGSLRGARGNSGVISSQLIRGFSKELDGVEEADTVLAC